MKKVLFLALGLIFLGGLVAGALAWANVGGTDSDAFTAVSQDESKQIAEDYLRSSPTFEYDGIENSVNLIAINTLRCPYCWEFTFEFQTRHAGHGDRTGQLLAQVITSHTARVIVLEGEVVSAVCCDNWNMMTQSSIQLDNTPQE